MSKTFGLFQVSSWIALSMVLSILPAAVNAAELEGFDIHTKDQSVTVTLVTDQPTTYTTNREGRQFTITLPDSRLSPEQLDNGLPVVIDNKNHFIGRAVPGGNGQVKIILPNLSADDYNVSIQEKRPNGMVLSGDNAHAGLKPKSAIKTAADNASDNQIFEQAAKHFASTASSTGRHSNKKYTDKLDSQIADHHRLQTELADAKNHRSSQKLAMTSGSHSSNALANKLAMSNQAHQASLAKSHSHNAGNSVASAESKQHLKPSPSSTSTGANAMDGIAFMPKTSNSVTADSDIQNSEIANASSSPLPFPRVANSNSSLKEDESVSRSHSSANNPNQYPEANPVSSQLKNSDLSQNNDGAEAANLSDPISKRFNEAGSPDRNSQVKNSEDPSAFVDSMATSGGSIDGSKPTRVHHLFSIRLVLILILCIGVIGLLSILAGWVLFKMVLPQLRQMKLRPLPLKKHFSHEAQPLPIVAAADRSIFEGEYATNLDRSDYAHSASNRLPKLSKTSFPFPDQVSMSSLNYLKHSPNNVQQAVHNAVLVTFPAYKKHRNAMK